MKLFTATPNPFPFAKSSGDVPILHNKLGSLSEIQNSVIGVNGAVTGTVTYATGQYGNSCYTGAVRTNRVVFNDGTTILPINKV